jgi:hypothetical protein
MSTATSASSMPRAGTNAANAWKNSAARRGRISPRSGVPWRSSRCGSLRRTWTWPPGKGLCSGDSRPPFCHGAMATSNHNFLDRRTAECEHAVSQRPAWEIDEATIRHIEGVGPVNAADAGRRGRGRGELTFLSEPRARVVFQTEGTGFPNCILRSAPRESVFACTQERKRREFTPSRLTDRSRNGGWSNDHSTGQQPAKDL